MKNKRGCTEKQNTDAEHAKYILRNLHALLNQTKNEQEEYRKLTSEDYEKFKDKEYTYIWGPLYDVPYKNVALVVASLVDMEAELKQVFTKEMTSTGYAEVFINKLADLEQMLEEEEFSDSEEEKLGLKLISACYQVLNSNFVCKVTYSVGMQTLLLEALQEDNNQAFFNAVYIDRGVLGSRLANQIVCNAILRDDGSFFDGLSRAIKRSSSVSSVTPEYDDLNALFVIEEDMLVEEGKKRFSEKEAYNFYVDDRQLYDEDGKDPFGSFKKVRQRFRERYRNGKDIKT